jgi:hypothetical protein
MAKLAGAFPKKKVYVRLMTDKINDLRSVTSCNQHPQSYLWTSNGEATQISSSYGAIQLRTDSYT